ncbi:hypothetical protein KP509_14G056000 [Ceratopteris richardii]|nr:hypothetical protein KP509_14G056000 [Ceratopteris richardii]
MNEDALLSLLINKSPPLSPTALSPESVLEDSLSLPLSSSSALLQMRMPSPSCTLSSPISSVRPKSPHGPISSASSSQSSLTAMPTMVTVARFPSSVSGASSEQCSSTCRGSPTSSFDFRVRSPTSTSSTPIFSSTKRNITQLQPTVLTTEEIAEIWGVFERRQALVPPP